MGFRAEIREDMTEQELRELMQEKIRVSGLEQNVVKISEMLTAAYGRGFQDGMDVVAKIYNRQPNR